VRILFVTHCFDPVKDGASVLFSQLAYGLAKRGVEVEVLTSNRMSTDDFINHRAVKIAPDLEKKNDVLIHRLDVFSRGRKIFRFGELVLKSGFCKAARLGPVFSEWRQIFKKRDIDWVVGGPMPLLTIVWAYISAKRCGAKLALVPCYHPGETEHQNRFLWRIIKNADLIFCLSEYEKKLYRKMGIKREKLSFIGGIVGDFIFNYHSYSAGRFYGKPAVLFLGVKAAHKRIPVLLEAMEVIWQRGIGADLIIAGPETLASKNIKNRIEGLKKEYRKNIFYYGEVSEKKKLRLLDRAWVLVNPSLFESFGIVFAEAWARKKPVIGADIPVLREIIADGQEGFLFKKDLAADLAEKIIRLINKLKLAEKMGKNGYNKALREYRQEVVVRKFLKVLEEQ
jgi:glycosyltransferase involved in cell wall biosynthesis